MACRLHLKALTTDDGEQPCLVQAKTAMFETRALS